MELEPKGVTNLWIEMQEVVAYWIDTGSIELPFTSMKVQDVPQIELTVLEHGLL